MLVRARRRRERVLRGLASVAAAATIAVYTWGVLSMFQDESSATIGCQRVAGAAHVDDVSGYETSFIPLHFGCRVDGVGTIEGFVPGFVNPTALTLALVTALLLAQARQARNEAPVPPATGDTTSSAPSRGAW
jgi:hypothetical protein